MKAPFLVTCYVCDRVIALVIKARDMDEQHTTISPRVEKVLRLKGKVKKSRFSCYNCRKERK